MKFNKKAISNIVFIVVLAAMIYPKSREWFMRQLAFSPSVVSVDEREYLSSYYWHLNGLNTENVNFENLRGEVVFVNFWATWCPPCRAELPMVQKLYNAYKDKVKFIFVSSENWGTINSFLKEHNYEIPVYNISTIPPKTFTQTKSIPATYLIDKKGNIVISKTGAADWNSDEVRKVIDDLLKQ